MHLVTSNRVGDTGNYTTDETMHFHYDAQGKPSMMMYNGTRFGYLYNAQGDVIGIITGGLTEKVKYTYDAWGRLLSITGSSANTIGKANPFRYRAYIYDQECGLYYLRTRYYNPNWCRFINGDILIIDNLFAYCVNNPIGLSDYTGNYADDAGTGSGISWIATAGILAGAPLTLAQMMQMLVTSLTNSVSVPKSNYDSSDVTLSNSIVEAVSGATPIQPENYKNYSLYVLTKGNNSTVLYIGITNNPKRREEEHRRNPKRGTDYNLTVVATDFTKEQARTAEAVAINAYTLKILENLRREIAPSKVKQYGDLLKSVWILKILQRIFLCLIRGGNMGTWGPGLYSNDDASDIKNDVRDMLAYGWTREAIITELTRNYNLRQIDEETSSVWLTIADTMWNYGILTEEIKRIAFRIIDEGIDIAAWAEKSTSIRKKRETVLNELRKKLVMQQPTSKKPRKSHFYRCNWPLGSVYAIPSCNGEYHAFIVVEEDEYKPSRYAPESDYVRTVSVALLCWSGNPEQLMQSLSHDIPILCMPFYNGGRIGETIGTYISINPYDFPPNIIKSLHYCGQVSPQFCKTIMINPMSHHSLFLSRFKYEYDYALSSNTIFHFSNDGKLISFESYQCNWEIGEVYALPAQTDYSLTVENRTPYHAFIVVDEGLYKLFTTLPEICSLRTVYIAILEWEGLPERLIHDLENGVSVLKCVECRPLGITNSQEEALRFCGHIDKLLCHKIAAQYSPPFMCTTLARFENDYRILSKKDIEACYFPFIKVQE